MSIATSMDLTGERLEVAVQPKRMYTPTILSVRAQSGTVELHLNDEQLAEIEFTIRQHFENMKYPESLEQSIKDVKLDYSKIKEEIA